MLPRVSVVIPVRNEEKFIERAIRSILENDYPKELLEVIVVDGMSEDGTREIVKDMMKDSHNIRLLDNPHRFTPHALNIGIENMNGDVMMIAGAHTTYSRNYISECVKALQIGYDVAGGIMKTLPRSDTPKARAIARVLSHPLGSGAKYRTREIKRIEEVDTVAYALYKREVFERVGKFNEKLIRNQDIEMNLRIKRSGGKIALVPTARSYYYARDTFRDLWKNNFWNGYWVIASARYARLPFRFRHIVPLLFVAFLIFTPMISLMWKPLFWIYTSLMALYVIAISLSSLKIAINEKDAKVFTYSFISFWILHLSYGLGSLFGILDLFKRSEKV